MPFEIRPIGSEFDQGWDALAGAAPESGFMQSTAWADFKAREGYETRRLGLFEGGSLVGGASLLRYPGEREGFILCPEGPVLPWADLPRAREGLRLVVRAAREAAEERGALGLRIEPHLAPPAPSLLRNWSRAPVDLTPVHTLIVDLTLEDEALLDRMLPKGRYNLRLSERHGVQVSASTAEADMARFYPLFAETAGRQGFYSEPFGFFLNLASALFPAGRAALFFASWEGQTLAAILVVFFGRRATYLYGGSAALERQRMPNYALQWAAMQEARARGCVEYDLYGYDPFGIPDHLYAGISQFKRQFGGGRRDWIGGRDLLFYDRVADRIVEFAAGDATQPADQPRARRATGP